MQQCTQRRTISFTLRQHLCKVYVGLSNKVWLAWILRKASNQHRSATLHTGWTPVLLWWRRRGRSVAVRWRCWYVVGILVERVAKLLVPLRMLPPALDCLRPLLLSIERHRAIRVLLAYVSLVWKIFLRGSVNAVADASVAGVHTPLSAQPQPGCRSRVRLLPPSRMRRVYVTSSPVLAQKEEREASVVDDVEELKGGKEERRQ